MTVKPDTANPGSDKDFETLLGQSPPRPQPPDQHESSVRLAVHEEWRLSTKKRRIRRLSLYAAAASVVVVAATLVFSFGPTAGIVDSTVAQIDKQFGTVNFASDRNEPANGSTKRNIAAGQIVETGAGSGLALRWHDGSSLRLDEKTRVAFSSGEEIYLHAGRLYFDSAFSTHPGVGGRADGVEVLSVRTDRGVAVPLGTRYVAGFRNGELSVAVREGRVAVKRSGRSSSAGAGYQLTVRQGGQETLTAIPVFGEAWTWIEKTTPPFDTEGRTVFEFLEWVSRESGRSLNFASDSAESLAKSAAIVGYGRIEFEPSVALQVIMLSTDLDWQLDEGVIVVSEKQYLGLNLRI